MTEKSFSIFGCKEYNQSDLGIDHLVMSTCRVFSCVLCICRYYFGCTGSSLLCRGFAVSGATLQCKAPASHCGGFSCCRTQAPGTWASVVVAHRPSFPAACEKFPDQRSNQCPLNRQVDSYLLHHRGSPVQYNPKL